MRIGITGHRGLDEPLRQRITELLDQAIAAHGGGELVLVTCLADGPDSWAADLVLAHHGRLAVVIPARSYRTDLPQWHHADYDRLLAQAFEVEETGLPESTDQAHMAASEILVAQSDVLLAVWDGEPARGYGGTADVVAYATSIGVPVKVIWPEGATRPAAS
ncbi:hypothetical protein OG689_42155 [Kitasatospora sp. NBC_00240]|uniref:hypothetical protein n=1 Tax=Kitasatospora sp. NBC_00240 TaxID=2903567 RepID=UPI00224EE72E|nr:hypothetical protein [Kitasatospora sp. NBC_00240]MCX5215761.1 hypothetical protein [Kitasatospora sp. NBC_00240]